MQGFPQHGRRTKRPARWYFIGQKSPQYPSHMDFPPRCARISHPIAALRLVAIRGWYSSSCLALGHAKGPSLSAKPMGDGYSNYSSREARRFRFVPGFQAPACLKAGEVRRSDNNHIIRSGNLPIFSVMGILKNSRPEFLKRNAEQFRPWLVHRRMAKSRGFRHPHNSTGQKTAIY